MKKEQRQQLIRQAVATNTIHNQVDLVAYLKAHGYEVTQATISRDIKEMQLIKINTAQGFIYQIAQQTANTVETDAQVLKQLLDSARVRIDRQDNLISMQTLPGSGPVVASAIKALQWSELFMALANDDGVLLIIKNEPTAIATIWQRLSALID
ncbi:arginine repressor [Lapidilactobacillus luobeiensis]|uniref:arginine repressor n=1 Tax=Lapidilactobacillus luobeiensis TaxID=2950371 RepID=UPI0021C444D6|nr:ArgR family transcriptional regulator [Lapidilactobacillus luobeiensis]